MQPYIKKFSNIGINDVETVGGKNASLGEMFKQAFIKRHPCTIPRKKTYSRSQQD
jgi:phosphoenolpyruvate synthase/pyruvate phosphate dikinase